jgi:MoxR-like ATPase
MTEKVATEDIAVAQEKLQKVVKEIKKEITGQDDVVRHILLCIVSGGHVLLEGMPGLAKTLLAKTIAKTIDLPFKRIQFTPDLLPADLIGTVIFNPKKASFEIRQGPIFTGVLLADEINRAPAKVQSALLQCMEEKLVTIGDTTFQLTRPFIVIATENPIDQEGTYQLPEAQMDRFLMKINVGYPALEEEVQILSQHGEAKPAERELLKVLSAQELLDISNSSDSIYVDPKLQDYIVRIVRNTRPDTTRIKSMKPYLKHGASPRASLSLLRASRAQALMEGRNYVLPEDIKFSLHEILRHRVLLTFEALSEEVSVETVLKSISDMTELP